MTNWKKQFEKKFANPDEFSSSAQFHPELSGKLYPELESFFQDQLSQLFDQIEKEVMEECQKSSSLENYYYFKDILAELRKEYLLK